MHIQSKGYEMHNRLANIPLRNAKGKSETMHKNMRDSTCMCVSLTFISPLTEIIQSLFASEGQACYICCSKESMYLSMFHEAPCFATCVTKILQIRKLWRMIAVHLNILSII